MRSIHIRPVLATVAVAIIAASVQLSASAQTIHNPGFEGPYETINAAPTDKAVVTGRMAPYWHDNSGWADVTVSYSEETKDVHEGKSALKVDFAALRNGGCQISQDTGDVAAGHTYALTLWIKGDGRAPVDVYLRRSGPPYTEYGKTTMTPTSEWQKVVVKAPVAETAPAAFMVHPGAPTVFTIDDATFADAMPAK